jgi:aminoglycoside phosphotransferase (APT) family kinase protein
VGIFHGDFQTANLFCSKDGHLKAVIDWELTGIGATLNDVGWIATFSDPEAWPKEGGAGRCFSTRTRWWGCTARPGARRCRISNWFRALAAYKFAIITGFNLSLHRRGKRHDPLWETTKLAMTPLIDRASELLG